MNVQTFHDVHGLSHAGEILFAWIVGLCSLTLYAAFTPYLAHDQARQLVVCFGGLGGLFVLTRIDRVRKKVAQVKELHWAGFHGSAA